MIFQKEKEIKDILLLYYKDRMSDKKFRINPCRSTVAARKVQGRKPDLRDINDVCYNTCAAFSRTNDLWGITSDCTELCRKCVNDCKDANYCDVRAPLPPPIFIQSPHFFPDCLEQTGNVEKAKKMCLERCCGNRLKGECIQNCLIDAAAVVGQEDEKTHQRKEEYKRERIIERYDDKKNRKNNKGVSFSTLAKANPIPFYIGLMFVGIFFVLIITLFIQTLFFGINGK